MPYIQVSLYPGRSEEQKQEFAKAVTKSAVEILKTKEDHVIVAVSYTHLTLPTKRIV